MTDIHGVTRTLQQHQQLVVAFTLLTIYIYILIYVCIYIYTPDNDLDPFQSSGRSREVSAWQTAGIKHCLFKQELGS